MGLNNKQMKTLQDYSTSEMTAELRRRGHAVAVWGIEDVKTVIEDYFLDDPRLPDDPLTEEEMGDIIDHIDNTHDCNFGITWEHLKIGVDWYLDTRG